MNTITPTLYNREAILNFAKDNLRIPETIISLIQKLGDIGTDAAEMLLPTSVQRNSIASKLEVHVNDILKRKLIGVAPRVIFVGF